MGKQMYRKLNVYERADHPHVAQKPQSLEVE
jgi:ribosomal protein L13